MTHDEKRPEQEPRSEPTSVDHMKRLQTLTQSILDKIFSNLRIPANKAQDFKLPQDGAAGNITNCLTKLKTDHRLGSTGYPEIDRIFAVFLNMWKNIDSFIQAEQAAQKAIAEAKSKLPITKVIETQKAKFLAAAQDQAAIEIRRFDLHQTLVHGLALVSEAAKQPEDKQQLSMPTLSGDQTSQLYTLTPATGSLILNYSGLSSDPTIRTAQLRELYGDPSFLGRTDLQRILDEKLPQAYSEFQRPKQTDRDTGNKTGFPPVDNFADVLSITTLTTQSLHNLSAHFMAKQEHAIRSTRSITASLPKQSDGVTDAKGHGNNPAQELFNILEQLGSSDLLSQAITNPTQKNIEAIFNCLIPDDKALQTLYQISKLDPLDSTSISIGKNSREQPTINTTAGASQRKFFEIIYSSNFIKNKEISLLNSHLKDRNTQAVQDIVSGFTNKVSAILRATTVLLPAIFSECNLRSNLLDHKRNFIIHEDMHGQQPTDLLNRLLTVVNQNLRSRGIPESRVEKIKSLLSQSVAKEYSPAQQQAYRELALIQMREAFGNRKDDLSACQQELYANSWLRFLIWNQPIEAKQSTKAETEQNKVYQPVVSSIVESIKMAIADYFFDQHTDAYGRQRSDVLLGQLNKIVASKASPSDQLKQIALLLTNMTKGGSTMNESTLHSLSGRSTQLLKRLLLTLGIRIPVDRLIKMPESKLFKTFLHSAPQQALFEKFPLNNLLLAKTETEQKIAEWLTTTSQEFKDLIQSQTSQSDEDWLLEQGVRYACLGNGLSAAIKIAAQHQKTNPQQASTADTKERKVAHDAPVEPRLKIITNIHQQALQRLYALLPQQHQLKSLHPNIQEMTTAINEFLADHKGSRSASKPAFFSQDPSELAYKKISEKLNGYYVSVNETQNRHIRASFGDPSFLLKEFNKIFIPPVQGQQSLFLRSF